MSCVQPRGKAAALHLASAGRRPAKGLWVGEHPECDTHGHEDCALRSSQTIREECVCPLCLIMCTCEFLTLHICIKCVFLAEKVANVPVVCKSVFIMYSIRLEGNACWCAQMRFSGRLTSCVCAVAATTQRLTSPLSGPGTESPESQMATAHKKTHRARQGAEHRPKSTDELV